MKDIPTPVLKLNSHFSSTPHRTRSCRTTQYYAIKRYFIGILMLAIFLALSSPIFGQFDPCAEYGSQTPDYVIGEEDCDVTYSYDIFGGNIFIQDAKIRVNGTLVINQAINFETCIFEMGPNAEIYIPENRGFYISETVMYSCDTLWRSIRVGFGGFLGINDGAFPNHIQDAKAAVFAHDGSNVILKHTNLVNNVIGFYIPPTYGNQPFPPSDINEVNLSAFFDLTFECTRNLLPASYNCPAYLPFITKDIQNLISISPGNTCYAGVLIHDVKMLQLSSDYPGADNTYKNLQNGIVAHNSDAFVQYSSFQDMPVNNSYPPIVGNGIYAKGYGQILDQRGFGSDEDPTFDNVRFPVYAFDMNVKIRANHVVDAITTFEVRNSKDRQIKLYDNKIYTIQRGIVLAQNDPTFSMEVYENLITLTGSSNFFSNNSALVGVELREMGMKHHSTVMIRDNIIDCGNAFWGGIIGENIRNVNIETNEINLEEDHSNFGIGLFASRRNIIRDNTIIGSGTSHSNFFTPANIGLLAFDSPLDYILCNTYENLRVGLDVSNNCASSIIGRNVFEGPFHSGLLYNHLGISGQQLNTMNIWPGNTAITGGFEARHLGGPMQVLNSIYDVHSNVTDGFPNPVSPDEDWFNYNNSHGEFEDCSEFNHPLTIPGPGDFEEQIALDTIEIPEDAPAYLWNLRKYLYEYLLMWPPSTWTSTVYEDFIAIHDTSAIGEWYTLEDEIRNVFGTDSSYLALQQIHLDTMEITMAALADLRYMLDTATTSGDSLTAITGIQDIIEDMSLYFETYHEVEFLLDSVREEVWEGILTDLTTAPASDYWTEALQTTWTEYLVWLIDDEDYMDSIAMVALADIAEECALTHGNAVYQAGGLRMLRPNMQFYYQCAEPESLILNTQEKALPSSDFHVVPNPADQSIIVHFNSIDQGAEFRIIDLNGKMLMSKINNSLLLELNVEQLSNGVYVMMCVKPNQKPESKVLIILR